MILLFNPPAPDGRGYTREGRCTQESGVWGTQWPPLSLATAAALLRQDGHSATIRDYPAVGLDSRALIEDIRRFAPTFAIWSTGTPTLPHDLALARTVRENSPATITAVIGTHVTVRPAEALREPALDVVIRGEPEGIIRELCRSSPPFSAVAGISLRDSSAFLSRYNTKGLESISSFIAPGKKAPALMPPFSQRGQGGWLGDNGAVRHNPEASPLAPEAIPAPSWEGLDLDVYRLPLKGRRFLMVAPVRGCPYRCTFCTAPLYYGHKLRRRPVAQVIDEIVGNIDHFGISEFFIWADTFTADRSYVHEFCRAIISRGLRISWTCNSRVDTVDAATLALMKEAGLWMISYGLESGSNTILATSGKGITVDQSRAAVDLAQRLKILTVGHFIFGLPGETEGSLAETLALALSLPLDFAQFYAAAPFPGTELYDEAQRNGWLRGATGNIPGSDIASQSSAIMELPGLTAARVEAFRRHAFRRFYLRPRAVWRLLSMAELTAVTSLMPALRRFLRWMG